MIKYYKNKIDKIILLNNKNNQFNKLKEELNTDKVYINNNIYNKLLDIINYSIKISLEKSNNNFEDNENNTHKRSSNINIVNNFNKFTSNQILSIPSSKKLSNINKKKNNINLPNYLKSQKEFENKLSEINKLNNKNKIKNEINKLHNEIINFQEYINNNNLLFFSEKIYELS